jgi:hypothetical protein
MSNKHRSVFVGIAKSLPVGLVVTILDALQLPGITPNVYRGVSLPAGDVVTSSYVEVRNDLLASDLAVLVLATDGRGHVSNDWTLGFVHELASRGIDIWVYLVPSVVSEADLVSESLIRVEQTQVRSLSAADDVPQALAAAVLNRFGDAPM